MDVQYIKPCTLAYIRVVGQYGNDQYEPTCKKLYEWATAIQQEESHCVFLYLDDPRSTPPHECRTDIALIIPDETETSGDILRQHFVGGKYGVIRKTLHKKSDYTKLWDSLIAQLIEKEATFDERPSFEYYHSYDAETGASDVSACIAIKGG